MSNAIAIDFHGDEIIAMKDEITGKVFANIRGICNSLSVNFSSQIRKLRANPTFASGLRGGDKTTPGGTQESWFIDAELLQLWLASIQPKRVGADLRDKLVNYQLEAAKALHDHFTQGFSINETTLEKFPDVLIDRISARISEKLNFTPVAPRLEERLAMLDKVFNVLGKPHEEVLGVLRDQAIAEITMQSPAPTMKESDFWYAADYFSERKKEGWKNALYKDERSFLQTFGKRAASIARRYQFRVVKQNQVLASGRIVEVNLHCKDCLDITFEQMAKERRVMSTPPTEAVLWQQLPLGSGGYYL